MNLEQTPNNSSGSEDYFLHMMELWGHIQQLGRNDVENAEGMRIIAAVQNGTYTPEEGYRKMYQLLESKQEH